ncbi:MAG: molybdenum cofactor biosynthesis protein MoaE [Caulobacteraceae bacterium]|nr:molybdenum cofactor biosynthesis protein MoaE [Caulobacteraceae bacterium]
MIRASVSLEPFSPDAEVARFSALRGDTCGAVVTFIGYCRGRSKNRAVTQLELEHYPGFTEGEINRLASATGQKHDVKDLLVIHRAGAIAAGEPIVLVAAMSAHRAAAFAAVEELMDYLKTDAPFWKRETGPDGAHWIEPTAEDRIRREERGK